MSAPPMSHVNQDQWLRLEAALAAAKPPLCDALMRSADWVGVRVTDEEPERAPGLLYACERELGHPGDHLVYRPDVNSIVSWSG